MAASNPAASGASPCGCTRTTRTPGSSRRSRLATNRRGVTPQALASTSASALIAPGRGLPQLPRGHDTTVISPAAFTGDIPAAATCR